MQSLAQKTLSYYEHRERSQIAAISGHFPAAGCNGDSGGPLACRMENDEWRLVGLLSYGTFPEGLEKCLGLFPDVYMRVANYSKFFEGNNNYTHLSGVLFI